MEFYGNSEVYTKNRNQIGTLDRVVIDPKNNEVTHLVVDKGFLLSDDKLVPVEFVDNASEDQIYLSVTEDELDDLQDFEETFHIDSHRVNRALGQERARPTPARRLFAYPPGNTHWWVHREYPKPSYYGKHKAQFNPSGTVTIEEGANVISSDEENIGEVDALQIEPSENRITHLIISQGILFEKRILIPSFWISKVSEDEIHLVVDRDLIESLPEYELEDVTS